MKSFFYLIFFLFGVVFLYGCGDPEEKKEQRSQSPAGLSPSPTEDEAENASNPLIEDHERRRKQLLEKYHKILKPNAPLPVKTDKTVCTKESKSINIEVNEYTDSTAEGNGTELLCDFLIDEGVERYATVQKDFCSKKAQENIDKLSAEGYSCSKQE